MSEEVNPVYCSNCGVSLVAHAGLFCYNCGTRINPLTKEQSFSNIAPLPIPYTNTIVSLGTVSFLIALIKYLFDYGSFVVGFVLGLTGTILGFYSLSRYKKNKGIYKGYREFKMGFMLCVVGLLLCGFLIAVYFMEIGSIIRIIRLHPHLSQGYESV
ncbi:MAG: hypothetical protein QM528_02515 [Phycisphaerales bacterium]|nr:hypothetical protein [Phycisphaerales bacterium]